MSENVEPIGLNWNRLLDLLGSGGSDYPRQVDAIRVLLPTMDVFEVQARKLPYWVLHADRAGAPAAGQNRLAIIRVEGAFDARVIFKSSIAASVFPFRSVPGSNPTVLVSYQPPGLGGTSRGSVENVDDRTTPSELAGVRVDMSDTTGISWSNLLGYRVEALREYSFDIPRSGWLVIEAVTPAVVMDADIRIEALL